MNQTCLNGCQPIQILNISLPVKSKDCIKVYDRCNNCYTNVEYSYSVDTVCWSCWLSEAEYKEITLNLVSDYLVRIKIPGYISSVTVNNEKVDYTTSLYSGFTFPVPDSTNIYNPYANMEGALELQGVLNETVANITGIPVYYIQVKPDVDSKDITFKEYALKSATAIKQIKLIIADGNMPSSKPDFTEWGLDWESDWETEITMKSFATAFGNNEKPMEGDLIYIPMMKRMWMVNQSYVERNGSLMWQATTFKVTLVKYQVDSSVNLNDQQDFVDNIVTTKYDELFGTNENIDSGFEAVNNTEPKFETVASEPIVNTEEIPTENTTAVDFSGYTNLIAVYNSDCLRKFATVGNIATTPKKLYYKGTQVAEYMYEFSAPSIISYQQKYCGEEGTISFIINVKNDCDKKILAIGKYKGVFIKKVGNKVSIHTNFNSTKKLEFNITSINDYYFVLLRWSRKLNLYDAFVCKYKYPDNIPLYKLQKHHFFFDIDNPLSTVKTVWNTEFQIKDKSDVAIQSFGGSITNIKLFDYYNDNLQEALMQYPTNQHLIINDTVSPFVNSNGQMIK